VAAAAAETVRAPGQRSAADVDSATAHAAAAAFAGSQALEQIARVLARSVQQASGGGSHREERGVAAVNGDAATPLGPTTLRARHWLRGVRQLRRGLASHAAAGGPQAPLRPRTTAAVQTALVCLAGGLHGDDCAANAGDSLGAALRQEAALCLGDLGAVSLASGDSDDDEPDDEVDGGGAEESGSARRSSASSSGSTGSSGSSRPSIKTRALSMLCEALLDADPWCVRYIPSMQCCVCTST
jgi:hypothetical protein